MPRKRIVTSSGKPYRPLSRRPTIKKLIEMVNGGAFYQSGEAIGRLVLANMTQMNKAQRAGMDASEWYVVDPRILDAMRRNMFRDAREFNIYQRHMNISHWLQMSHAEATGYLNAITQLIYRKYDSLTVLGNTEVVRLHYLDAVSRLQACQRHYKDAISKLKEYEPKYQAKDDGGSHPRDVFVQTMTNLDELTMDRYDNKNEEDDALECHGVIEICFRHILAYNVGIGIIAKHGIGIPDFDIFQIDLTSIFNGCTRFNDRVDALKRWARDTMIDGDEGRKRMTWLVKRLDRIFKHIDLTHIEIPSENIEAAIDMAVDLKGFISVDKAFIGALLAERSHDEGGKANG